MCVILCLSLSVFVCRLTLGLYVSLPASSPLSAHTEEKMFLSHTVLEPQCIIHKLNPNEVFFL